MTCCKSIQHVVRDRNNGEPCSEYVAWSWRTSRRAKRSTRTADTVAGRICSPGLMRARCRGRCRPRAADGIVTGVIVSPGHERSHSTRHAIRSRDELNVKQPSERRVRPFDPPLGFTRNCNLRRAASGLMLPPGVIAGTPTAFCLASFLMPLIFAAIARAYVVGRTSVLSRSHLKNSDASCALCARHRSSMFALVATPPAAYGCTW